MVAVTLSFTAIHFLTSFVFSSLSFSEQEDIPIVRDQNFQTIIFDHAASHSFLAVGTIFRALRLGNHYPVCVVEASSLDRPSSPQSKDYK